MKILYGAPASVFVRKPRILLQEKGISFITVPVNPMLEVSFEFKSLSPIGKIPVFRDENYVIADSSAICAYIDAKYPSPSFYPTDPEQLGQVLWLEEYADTVLFQAIAPCYYQSILVPLYRNREPDFDAIETALAKKLPVVADYLEQTIGDNQYLVGDQFTVADVAVVSAFLNMCLAGFPLPESTWPKLTAYLNNHFQRESIRSCIVDLTNELRKLNEIETKAE